MTQLDIFEQDLKPIAEAVARAILDPLKVARISATIERVTAHAEEAAPGWKERALAYVREYAASHQHMMCEHCRIFAELDGLERPHDERAWGGIMRTAAHRGIIQADGYAPAVSSNLSPKRYWKSLIQERVA